MNPRYIFFALVALFALSSFVFADNVPITPGTPIDLTVPAQSFSNVYTFTIDASIREITVVMTKKNATDEADPDLYIRFGEAPTRSSYDGSDTTRNAIHKIVLDGDKVKAGTYYIIMYGFNALTSDVKLVANTYQCPGANCGAAENHGTCAADTGVCKCNAGWIKSDCSAPYKENAALDEAHVGELITEQVAYFNFTIQNSSPLGYLKAILNRQHTHGLLLLTIAHNRLPTANDNDGSIVAYQSVSSVNIDIDENAFSDGFWIVAVSAGSRVTDPLDFSLRVHMYSCKNDCSGNGSCDVATSVCTCDPNYMVSDDCSTFSRGLSVSEPINFHMKPFTVAHFSVPIPAAYSNAPVEMAIHLDAADDSQVTVFPNMYVKYNSIPTDQVYDIESPKPATKHQTLFVAASGLFTGNYYLTVANMNSGDDIPLKVSLTLTPHCQPNCYKNGNCNELGVCVCNKGAFSGDCTVTKDVCKNTFTIEDGGVSTGVTVFLVFLFLAVGGAVGYLFAKKYVTNNPSDGASGSEVNYNQLN